MSPLPGIKTSLYPLAAQTKARPIPVLPLVGSIISGFSYNLTLSLGSIDHGNSDSILDTTEWIASLQLGQQLGPALDLGKSN